MDLRTSSHTIEPEVLQRPPRRIAERTDPAPGRVRGGGLLFLRIFSLPFLGFGLYILGMALSGTIVRVAGTRVPVLITRLTDTPDPDSDSSGDIYRADYTYHYRGVRYTGSASISNSTYWSLSVERQTPVLILPWAPAYQPILLAATSNQLPFIWSFTLIWNAIVITMLRFAFITPIMLRRVYRVGVPAVAMITGKSIQPSEDSSWYSVKYEFTPIDTAGRSATVRGQTIVGEGDWDRLKAGDAATVLYLPGKPRWNALYPYGPYRILP